MENKILKKNFYWNLIGSTLYASTSLVFLIIVTRINGVSDAGIFTFAFSFVCVIQVIGTYAGRTFQVTERKKDITDSDFIIFRLFNCLLMILFCFAFCWFKEYASYKTICIILLLAYRVIDSYSEVFFGVFQKYNKLYQAGISLTIRSIGTVIAFLLIDIFTKNLIYSIIGLTLIDVLVFMAYDLKKYKIYKIKITKISKTSIKYLICAGFSVFIFTILMQYVTNASKFAIDNYLSDDIQAIYGIILMPATLMTLCSQLIINPFLYDINKALRAKDYSLFNKIIWKISITILIIGFTVWLLCLFAGIPVLNFLYNIDISEFLFPLLIIVAGSVLYGTAMVLMNALIAIRKNNIQVIIFIVVSIFALISAEILVLKWQLIGASLCYLYSVGLLLLLYIATFIYETRKLKWNNH